MKNVIISSSTNILYIITIITITTITEKLALEPSISISDKNINTFSDIIDDTLAFSDSADAADQFPSDNVETCPGEFIHDFQNASYVIGGLFPVHRYSNHQFVYNVDAIIWVEAFLFAIDQINKNKVINGYLN